VTGTAANFIALRIGAEDAPLIASHLGLEPEFEYAGMGTREISGAARLVSLPKHHAYARVPDDPSIDGSIELTLLPPPPPIHRHPERLISRSRSRYGGDRATVEEKIARFLAPGASN